MLDILKGWQAAGEPYIKIVAPIAWSRTTTPTIATAPQYSPDITSDIDQSSQMNKPIYMTVSMETLPVKIDGLSSSSLTSLSSTAADGLDVAVMSPSMDQLKAELYDLKQQLRRANTRFNVLL